MSAAWLGENWPAVVGIAGGLIVAVLLLRQFRTTSAPLWRIPELRALAGYVAGGIGISIDRPGGLDEGLVIVGLLLWVWGLISIGRRNRVAREAASGDDAGAEVARR